MNLLWGLFACGSGCSGAFACVRACAHPRVSAREGVAVHVRKSVLTRVRMRDPRTWVFVLV